MATKNWFNRPLPLPKFKHSTFDLSHDYKSSLNMGKLYPTFVEECVPSDKFTKLNSEIFLRFAPLTFPIMHRIKVRQNFFFVPIRLILGDELYEDFLNDKVDIAPLRIYNDSQVNVDLKNTLIDYLGYQPRVLADTDDYVVPNPIAMFSYYLIWMNWYADENLDSAYMQWWDVFLQSYRTHCKNGTTCSINVTDLRDGFLSVHPISYTKDYFTAGMTQPQKGEDTYLMSPLRLTPVDGSLPSSWTGLSILGSATASSYGAGAVTTSNNANTVLRSSTTIRDLWALEMIQNYLQTDNLYGTRTIEKLAGHFGVISSDARMQLPQYVDGGQSIVQISEVVQTSATETGSALGSYAGKATSYARTKNTRFFCEEHGFMIGLLSLVPDNGYMTGCPRYFFKKNIYDFADPQFNNIGYQSVYNGEIFLTPDNSNTGDFCYQPRYSEYRQHRSIATGDFRDTTLMAWHLNRNFATRPPFNANFIHVNQADCARIFNNTDVDDQHIYLDCYNNVEMSRPISYMPDSMHIY